MANVLQAPIKAAALGGIFFAWANFTIEAFKLSWHIISLSPEKETFVPVRKAVCGYCKKLYDDDGLRACKTCRFETVCANCLEQYDDDEYHVIHGTHLCEACRAAPPN